MSLAAEARLRTHCGHWPAGGSIGDVEAGEEQDGAGEAGVRAPAGRAFCLALAALLACAAQAPADGRWLFVSRDPETTSYIDPSTLEREGQTRTILARLVPDVVQDGAASALVKFRFECVRRASAMLHLTLLRADGSQLSDTEITGNERASQPAPPDTNIGVMLEAVCRL